MKDEMASLLEIVKKLKELRSRQFLAAVIAGDETKAKQVEYAVEAFGMVEWMIEDPKYADYIRRLYEQFKFDEREQESPKDLNVAKASISTETNPTEISIVPTQKGDGAMIQIPIERREEAVPEGYVKVVRCRNCKYCEVIDKYEMWCYGVGSPARLMCADDFCSRGERKEETEC